MGRNDSSSALALALLQEGGPFGGRFDVSRKRLPENVDRRGVGGRAAHQDPGDRPDELGQYRLRPLQLLLGQGHTTAAPAAAVAERRAAGRRRGRTDPRQRRCLAQEPLAIALVGYRQRNLRNKVGGGAAAR